MVKWLNSTDTQFESKLKDALSFKSDNNDAINETVKNIIQDVIERGDDAIIEYTNRFDRTNYTADTLKITPKEIETALASIDGNILEALETAAERIKRYHEKQLPQDALYTDELGVELGWRWTAVDKAGLYVPGGQAAYPSSVLMNAIPATVAGVTDLVMVVPTPDGVVNPVILAAAHVAGITEIYKMGGAQAIAALAYGTHTIPKVDVIVGPGNAYVASAKRQVFGQVGIDMIAGPSEILVIADNSANPEWIAADLLSQAEHDADARSILVTTDEALAKEIEQALENTLQTLERKEIAEKSWNNNGLIIIAKDNNDAAHISNMIAPEHLELCVNDAHSFSQQIKHAGAIFKGHFTPEAAGDYIAGPSHVLPTSGSARFASGLDVYAFLKRSSIIGCTEASLNTLGPATIALAEKEGLGAHALSMAKRLGNNE